MGVNAEILVNISFHLASLLSISLQPNGFIQNTIGRRQDVICSILLSSDVDPDSVKLSWLRKDDIVTADGRVTIITSSAKNTLKTVNMSSIIHFDPLLKEDEGEYTCYASINGSFTFESIKLENFKSKHTAIYIITTCVVI